MLTFFRRIRKALLDSGAVTKYLLYAIGEIALVVIGILIALQINNWNEWRKDRQLERELLVELSNNVERNCSLLQSSIESLEGRNRSTEVVFDILEHRPLYADSMDRYFFGAALRGFRGRNMSFNGYEALKNAGFDKIINDSLQKRIIYLFEEKYRDSDDWKSYNNEFAINDANLWYKYFVRNGTRLKPINYERLVESTEISSYYHGVLVLRNIYIQTLYTSLQESQKVLQLTRAQLRNSSQ